LLKLKKQQETETDLYENTKKSLVDLLKTDSNLLKSIFGRVPDAADESDNRLEILRREAQKQMQTVQREDRFIDMETEYNDILKASLCSFKFIALRTLSASVPASLYFTFNFHNFQQVTTEVVYLKTAQQLESRDMLLSHSAEIASNKQYLLVYTDLVKMLEEQKPVIEQILERAIKQQFDVNPVATRNYQEHVEFA
jgi:hypothetical protein